ncbi:MAG: ATP-binding protein [Gammaproteobacteria bacterium]|nr:ATP-binding protein [Gammaproteobacteria bacterium]
MIDSVLKDRQPDQLSEVESISIRRSRIDALYRFHNISIVAIYLGPIPLLWYILTNTESHFTILAWITALFVVNTLFLLVKFFREKSPDPTANIWLILVGIRALTIGSMLGAIPALVDSEDVLLHMVLLIFLSFYIVGGVTVYSPFWKFLLLYNIPIITFAATHAVISGQASLVFIGYTYYIWIPITFVMVRAFGKFINNAIFLAHSNDTLVVKLASEKKDAEQANLGKSRFIAAASHDLRQPLHALSLFGNQLDKVNSDEARATLHKEIKLSIKALSTMFDGLLDISRIDSDKVSPKLGDFKLNDIFDNLQSEFLSAAEVKNISLRFIPTTACVHSDKNMLDRILRNLISNAIRYTDSGKVLIGVRHIGKKIKIQVIDTGIGIEDSQKDFIFDEFYQIGNSERDREKGIGLGLAIVKRLATTLDHEISVDSIPGKGSCFSITLPSGNSEKACCEYKHDTRETKLDNYIALIIDDDTHILAAMRMTLENWGCTVFAAESGQQAKQVLDSEGILPDIFIVDYRLRDNEKGCEVIKKLRTYLNEEISAILLTGDLELNIQRNEKLANVTLLHKPVDPLTLNNTLVSLQKASSNSVE